VQASAFFQSAFVSSKGGKAGNQDTCAIFQAKDDTWVFCVADGLGGHAGGRMASQIAINSVYEYSQQSEFKFADRETMLNVFNIANSNIISGQNQDGFTDMRSTLVVLFMHDDLAFWGHIGDVRLYHFRDQKVLFQTKDHSVPQMLADTGDILNSEIRSHPDRSRLLRALGTDSILKITTPHYYQQIETGDHFHLSTDGFWEWLLEDRMLEILAEIPINMQQATQVMEQEVIHNALQKDQSHDNLTALNIAISHAELNQENWRKTRFIHLGKT